MEPTDSRHPHTQQQSQAQKFGKISCFSSTHSHPCKAKGREGKSEIDHHPCMGEEVQLVLIEAVEAAMQSALLIAEEARQVNNQQQEKTLFFTVYSLQIWFWC